MTPDAEVKNGTASKGHMWGVQLRREIDILMTARKGDAASALMFELALEAVTADTGMLLDSRGKAGFAWQPEIYRTRNAKDPVAERIRSAGASLGRILAGGHPTHRTYLAFMEAVYMVTTQQENDVIARVERLWDQLEKASVEADIHSMIEEQVEIQFSSRRGVVRRFLTWVKHLFRRTEVA